MIFKLVDYDCVHSSEIYVVQAYCTLHRAITVTYKILCQTYCTLHRAITVTYKILCQAYCTLLPCDNCYI